MMMTLRRRRRMALCNRRPNTTSAIVPKISKCIGLKPSMTTSGIRPQARFPAKRESLTLPHRRFSCNPHLAAVGVDAIDLQILGRKALAAHHLHFHVAVLFQL